MNQHHDPNRVIRFPEHGVSVTPFEQHVDALASVLLAAGYPSDTERRRLAAKSCAIVDLDYIEAVARLCEQTGATPDTARWKIVEYLGATLGEMRAMGGAGREGVMSTGHDADTLGNALTHDPEEG